MKFMMLVCVDPTRFAEDEAAGYRRRTVTPTTAGAFRGSTT